MELDLERLRPLSTPGGGEGWCEAGVSTARRDGPMQTNANECQYSDMFFANGTMPAELIAPVRTGYSPVPTRPFGSQRSPIRPFGFTITMETAAA